MVFSTSIPCLETNYFANKITFSLPDKIGSIMVNNKKHTIEVSKEKINSVLKEFS